MKSSCIRCIVVNTRFRILHTLRWRMTIQPQQKTNINKNNTILNYLFSKTHAFFARTIKSVRKKPRVFKSVLAPIRPAIVPECWRTYQLSLRYYDSSRLFHFIWRVSCKHNPSQQWDVVDSFGHCSVHPVCASRSLIITGVVA